MIDFYPRGSNTNNGVRDPWLGISVSGEIDLREEIYGLLHGSSGEIPKGRKGILRRMRRDHNNNLILCQCVDPVTHEPTKDHFCPYCWGEGYLWDEEWITCYKMQVASQEGFTRKDSSEKAGYTNIPAAFFYVEYNVNPNRFDKIIEMKRDLEGELIVPYERESIWDISTAEDFRSDNGRVEYWRAASTKQSVIPTWKDSPDGS